METTCRQFIRKRIGVAISPERWESMMDIEIDQADGITGSFPFPEGTGGGAEGALHFYRASLTVDRALFSDEVDKWSLLSILWQEVARWQYEVVGFTLMDDQLQLVLCKNRDNEEKHTGFESDQKEAVPEGTMIEDLGKSYRDYFVKE